MTSNFLVAFLFFATVESDSIPADIVVDAVEYNYAYVVEPCWFFNLPQQAQPQLKLNLKQTIGWKLDPDGVWHVDWWSLEHSWPVNYENGYYVLYVKTSNRLIRVKTRHVFITHTLGDPEIADRQRFPICFRAGLDPLAKIRQKCDCWYHDPP
ncbi:MAG: hypothetical protein KatS3mg087_1203 [Patescibacteria group bacterium]|nr:MAG: hypothetical protein KatS3mg087_1203 [Patescibacteria group bacterium]